MWIWPWQYCLVSIELPKHFILWYISSIHISFPNYQLVHSLRFHNIPWLWTWENKWLLHEWPISRCDMKNSICDWPEIQMALLLKHTTMTISFELKCVQHNNRRKEKKNITIFDRLNGSNQIIMHQNVPQSTTWNLNHRPYHSSDKKNEMMEREKNNNKETDNRLDTLLIWYERKSLSIWSTRHGLLYHVMYTFR